MSNDNNWLSYYTSQDVETDPDVEWGYRAVPTWSVYREWFASRDDEGDPWGQEYVSTHATEAEAEAEADRLFSIAHPETNRNA